MSVPDIPVSSRQGQLGAVLFIADVLHPVDDLAVEHLRNRYVRHCSRGRGAVPVLLVWCKPHDVARPNVLDRPPERCTRPAPDMTINVLKGGCPIATSLLEANFA